MTTLRGCSPNKDVQINFQTGKMSCTPSTGTLANCDGDQPEPLKVKLTSAASLGLEQKNQTPLCNLTTPLGPIKDRGAEHHTPLQQGVVAATKKILQATSRRKYQPRSQCLRQVSIARTVHIKEPSLLGTPGSPIYNPDNKISSPQPRNWDSKTNRELLTPCNDCHALYGDKHLDCVSILIFMEHANM